MERSPSCLEQPRRAVAFERGRRYPRYSHFALGKSMRARARNGPMTIMMNVFTHYSVDSQWNRACTKRVLVQPRRFGQEPLLHSVARALGLFLFD